MDGQTLGALLLVPGGRVDLRRNLWRRKGRPAPKPRPGRNSRSVGEQKAVHTRRGAASEASFTTTIRAHLVAAIGGSHAGDSGR
jgi:hypothetical protein